MPEPGDAPAQVRILLVEDHEVVRDGLGAMLAEEVVGVVSRHDLLKQMCRSDATVTVEVENL